MHLMDYSKDILSGQGVPLNEVRITHAEALDIAGRLRTHEGLFADLRRLLDEGVFFLPNGGPERDRGLAFLDKLKEAGYTPHEGGKVAP